MKAVIYCTFGHEWNFYEENDKICASVGESEWQLAHFQPSEHIRNFETMDRSSSVFRISQIDDNIIEAICDEITLSIGIE